MTIEVEAPDGSIVEFPDGTSDDVMSTAMRKTFGGPAPVNRSPVTGRPAEPMTFNADTGPLQAADDIVRLIANGASFGYADKLAGAMNGTGTEAERAKSAEASQRAGSAGNVAELGGAAAVPIGMGNAGLSLVGKLGSGAATGAAGLAARTGLAAAEGAGYGALGAMGHDTDVGDGALMGAIFGAGGNVASEAVTKGASSLAGLARPAPPTTDAIRQAADAAYARADNSGVIFTPEAIDRLRQTAIQQLADFGYDPALQPGAAAVVRRLDDMLTTGQGVTLKGLDTLRKVASNGYVQGNKSNNAAIGDLIDLIDNAIANPVAGDVMTGNAQAGADALGEARDYWSRLAKADRVMRAEDAAGLRAASTGKGTNVDNATRQNMRQILAKPRGFTPDEQAALRQTVEGTPTQNVLRWAGSLAPTGVVSMGGGAGLGAAAASAIGLNPAIGALAVPAISAGAKWAADAGTRNNVQDLLDIIMSGGRAPAPTAVQSAITGSRDAITRGAIGAGANVMTKPSEKERNRGR